MKKIIFITLFLSVFVFGSGGVSLVETQKIEKKYVHPLEEFIGTLYLSKQGNISSQSSGKVTIVHFETTKSVKKGDILVGLDTQILDTQIVASRENLQLKMLNLKNKTKEYERYKNLLQTKSVSQKIYDDAQLQYEMAQAEQQIAQSALDELKIQKEYKTIKAPYDGVIVSKNVEVGEWLNIGSNIAQIVNGENLDLVFDLPSSYINTLDKKTQYKAYIKNKEIDVNLVGFIPKGNIKTRSFQVKFQVQNKDTMIFDGMEVKIKLPKAKNLEALIVPRDSVIKRFGQNVVFVNMDEKAMMIPVEIINYLGDKVAIVADGLAENQEVVSKGNERIFPNTPIQVINKK